MKACPFCGEEILAVAIRCKHCHADLDVETEGEPGSEHGFATGDDAAEPPSGNVVKGHVHWLFWFRPNWLWLSTILFAVLPFTSHEPSLFVVLGGLGFFWGYKYLAFRQYKLEVTPSHVVWSTTVFRGSTVKMALRNIESVQVEQSLSERLIDCGTILLHGNGRDVGRLELVAEPKRFADAIEANQT